MAAKVKRNHTAASLRAIATELHQRARALEETAEYLDRKEIAKIEVLGSIGVKRPKTGALAALEIFSDKAWKAASMAGAIRPPTGK